VELYTLLLTKEGRETHMLVFSKLSVELMLMTHSQIVHLPVPVSVSAKVRSPMQVASVFDRVSRRCAGTGTKKSQAGTFCFKRENMSCKTQLENLSVFGMSLWKRCGCD